MLKLVNEITLMEKVKSLERILNINLFLKIERKSFEDDVAGFK